MDEQGNCRICHIPLPSHASDCPDRPSRADAVGNPKLLQIAFWMQTDADVRLMVRSVQQSRDVLSLTALSDEVIDELYECIETLLEESPTNLQPGDPRRTQ